MKHCKPYYKRLTKENMSVQLVEQVQHFEILSNMGNKFGFEFPVISVSDLDDILLQIHQCFGELVSSGLSRGEVTLPLIPTKNVTH